MNVPLTPAEASSPASVLTGRKPYLNHWLNTPIMDKPDAPIVASVNESPARTDVLMSLNAAGRQQEVQIVPV
jgi:hypothetical protein